MPNLWRWRVGKLLRLSRAEIALLTEAQLFLLFARVLVAWRRKGRLIKTGGSPAEGVPTPDLDRARRLDLAVKRAAEHGVFRPHCLVRAIALQRMLDLHGLRGSRLCLGVRHDGRDFAAHAWLEYGGAVLADRERHVRRFEPLSDVSLHTAR